MDLSDERQPFASPKTGSTMTLNDEFSLKELTEQQEDIKMCIRDRFTIQ